MREGHRLLLAGDRAGDRAHSGQPAATRPGDRGLEDHTKSPGAGLRANEGLPKGTHQAQRTPNGGSKAIQAINGRTRHYHHRNRRVEALLRPNSRGNLLPSNQTKHPRLGFFPFQQRTQPRQIAGK